MAKVGVIGAGSWGIALAKLLRTNGNEVTVWSIVEEEVAMLRREHEHIDKLPGVKLGLTNIVVVLMLYSIGTKEAFCVSVIRIFIVGILFGNLIGILYSLGGGILSFLVMALLKKGNHLGCISVSVAGGIAHNIGQILIAALVVSSHYVLYYFPVLLIAGLLTGFLIGLLAQELIVRLRFLTEKYHE